MAKPNTRSDPKFTIAASVVFQLGRDLITDDIQALVELVKNSYDADSRYALVAVDTEYVAPPDSPVGAGARGIIRITDDGFGMTLADVDAGWLTVSDSPKKRMKDAGETTPSGRTPLGDKGLGRLGIQRLGDHVRIVTQAERDGKLVGGELEVAFSWLEFTEDRLLGDVPIHLREEKQRDAKGTTVEVFGLHNLERWSAAAAKADLERELSAVISPYPSTWSHDFRVVAEINGARLSLAEISDRLRGAAELHYQIDFDGERLTIAGRAAFAYFRPPVGRAGDGWPNAVEADSGARLREYLLTHPGGKQYSLRKPRSSRWFIESRATYTLAELAGIDTDEKGRPSAPGPFHAEIDHFHLEQTPESLASVFDSRNQFRRMVRGLSGVKVYRDGFAVRLPHDWMGLSKGWTGGGSWYTLRPHSTIGYVSISADRNRALDEKTDREGFSDTPEFRNFRRCFDEFVKFADDVQDFIRRSTTGYLQDQAAEAADVDVAASPTQVVGRVESELKSAATDSRRLQVKAADLQASLRRHTARLDDLAREAKPGGEAGEVVAEVQDALAEMATGVEQLATEASQQLARSGQLDDALVLLAMQIEDLQSQVSDFYEAAALGLTAEVLSHEIDVIADSIARRTDRAKRRLASIKGKPALALIEYLADMRGAVTALRKQLSHLDPGLRYVRERREPIDMPEFIEGWSDHHRDRLGRKSISVHVEVLRATQFVVEMNRGKLTQVLDNLVNNSEYWIVDDIQKGLAVAGRVDLVLECPVVRVSDSGPGVSRPIEAAVFEPFVTAKPREHGRGLGLFICRQLLEPEGCQLRLLPDRNEHERRHIFELDLRGALCDDGAC